MKSSIKAATDVGIEYHIASNETGIDQSQKDAECSELGIYHHHVNISRSPASIKENYKAYKQIIDLISQCGIDAIHCNTPVGGIIGRLAGKKAGIKVIYQAHGFHFWQGAPKKNWIVYYPVEKLLSKYTDVLITIAKDDYEIAKTMYARAVKYVHGIGVDLARFNRREKFDRNIQLRKKMGIPEEAALLLSVGELNGNKNHKTVINALNRIDREDIYYIICGEGESRSFLQSLIDDTGLHSRVILAGFRSDIQDFYRMADLFVFPSLREGIPGAIMEAIATGVPVIASNIRGVRDIVPDETYRFSPTDADSLARLIEEKLSCDNSDNQKMNYENLTPYAFDNVVRELEEIYKNL